MNNSSDPTIIVGGGFLGLFAALHLSHRNYRDRIILIDAQNRFAFKPLLYEYLTGEMQDEQVFPRYEELLEGSNITFVRDRVTEVDWNQRLVKLASDLHYQYRYLVLAVGSTQGYFGTEGAKENAFPFRTREDAIKLERHLRSQLQQASQTADVTERSHLLTFAVVGAGPAGVEMAATLADLLPDWYIKLGGNFQELRILLINHSEEILSGDINEDLKEIAIDALEHRTVPVELLLGVSVKSVTPDNLAYQEKNGSLKTLGTQTTIWTAGTETNSLIKNLSLAPEQQDKHGLPIVTPTLQLLAFPDVFAGGDCAVVRGESLPPVAQVAYQQGAGIADNLMALCEGRAPHPVEVNVRGTLLKLGIGNGIANLFDRFQIKGKTGDLIRNAAYLELLPAPVHNFKATTDWLTDEIFHRHRTLESATTPKAKSRVAIWIGGVAIAIALVIGSVTLWRTTRPSRQQPPSLEQSR